MTAVSHWLHKNLAYTFRDAVYLEQALTHRSAGGDHNERLEFLGDAVLGMLIAERLYLALPQADEGYLSRLRAHLVRRETLAQVGHEIGLGERIKLGSGELKSGGFRRASIVANGLEALLGAIYLDGGLEPVAKVIDVLFESRLRTLPSQKDLKDPKTRLQEMLQGRGIEVPSYAVEEVSGEAHKRHFAVSCSIPALDRKTTANGTSRRAAEQRAAAAMIDLLGDD
ncbi:MAG: ribonuclease III [Gammaproteobacteria bacterium]|nr:MAG: ribonuclease III [Gammaproteobacteria bacterium]